MDGRYDILSTPIYFIYPTNEKRIITSKPIRIGWRDGRTDVLTFRAPRFALSYPASTKSVLNCTTGENDGRNDISSTPF